MNLTESNTKSIVNFKSQLLILLLVVFYVSEGIGKVIYFSFGDRILLAKAIKAVVLLLFLALTLKSRRLHLYLFLSVLFFCIGQLFITPNFNFQVLTIFGKYIFPIIALGYFTVYKLTKAQLQKAIKVFEYILLFNSILMIIGYVFDIKIFETYKGSRFGYNGLFVSSATGSYVYTMYLILLLVLHKANIVFKWKFYAAALICLLLGTKGIYLGLVLTVLFYFCCLTSGKIRIIGLTVFGLISAYGVYYLLFAQERFRRIMEEDGLITSLLSFRDVMFYEKMLPFIQENWTWVNYLFGGVNNIKTRSELGFVDLFFFLGSVGGAFYIYSYYKSFFTFPLNKIALFFIVLFTTTIFFTGNFFLNASVVIYLVVLRAAFSHDT